MDRQQVAFGSAWSVTRVLATVFGSPEHIPAKYLRRGSDVHRWTENYDLGQTYTPDPEWGGWCEGYKVFTYTHSPSWDDNGIETVFETGVYHGVIDRIGLLGNTHRPDRRQAVCDIKTGRPNPKKDALQLAAYAQGMFPATYQQIDRVGIYIAKDGTYKLRFYDDTADFKQWNDILQNAIR